MTYYKITTRDNRSLIERVWTVQYSMEHWVRPNFGKLFVFDSLTNVLKYHIPCLVGQVLFPIWKCEVKDPEILAVMSNFLSSHKRFWKSFPNFTEDNYVKDTPDGTIGASAVRLLERTC